MHIHLYFVRETNSPITPIGTLDLPSQTPVQPLFYGFSRSNSPESSDNSANSPNNNPILNNSLDNTNLLELMVCILI